MSSVAVQRRDRLDARAVGLVLTLCALWGLQQITVKLVVSGGLPPVLQAAIRSAGASLLVVAWVALREGGGAARELLRPDRSLLPGLLLGVTFTGEFATYYPGLALTTASRGVLFLYTGPFFTAFGAHLLVPGDRLTPRKAIGLLIAFAGVAAAFADGFLRSTGSVSGDLLCLSAGVLWAASTMVIKRSSALGASSAAKVLLYQIGVSVPFLLGLSAAMGEWSHVATPTALAWACLAYQTAIVAFASYLVWFWMVLTYSATRLSPFSAMTPVFGVGFGSLLLGETVGPACWPGSWPSARGSGC